MARSYETDTAFIRFYPNDSVRKNYDAPQGLMTSSPPTSKRLVLRVATIRLCAAAVAAM